MLEPFLMALPEAPDPSIWREEAPIDFKDMTRKIFLVPMSSRIQAGDRGMYTVAEVEEDPSVIKSARNNTLRNRLRKNTDNDFISIRSNGTDTPCAAAFLCNGRMNAFESLKIGRIQDYYVIFMTPDEVLFADKEKLRPANIRRILTSIRNRVMSMYRTDAPILSMEVLEYDTGTNRYEEV